MEGGTLTTIEKVIFLKSIDIFKHAAIEELGRVAALTEEVYFAAGETIIREAEPADAIYLILDGRAGVERNGRIMHELGKRQELGTVAALDLRPALHNVKAIEPLHALKLNTQDFHDILSQDYELVQAVFHALCQVIREREPT